MVTQLLDVDGTPLRKELEATQSRLHRTTQTIVNLRRQIIQARYDAAQTFTGNEKHWSNADHFGPNAVASLEVRKTLRSRSRYEIIENNPYLKGTILTICNDFVGSGPKLQITDKRLSPLRRRRIEQAFREWFTVRKIRQKLWRMRMAKFVDGEGFLRAFRNTKVKHPVALDFQCIEADRVSSQFSIPSNSVYEVDGVRFDQYDQVQSYHILDGHPGEAFLSPTPIEMGGSWIPSKYIVHWFRQDRSWLRGIPELTPSLPLCALLRRYTLAVVEHAEVAADLTAIMTTDGPPSASQWTDGNGNMLTDTPFDTMPIERGTIMNLPYRYDVHQLNAVPLGIQYDEFVGSLLREIMRPAMVTYNRVSGSSKDSNMASGVLDDNIYKSGQQNERIHAQEDVLDPMFNLWWEESRLVPGYLGDNFLRTDPQFRDQPPAHKFRWDRIGVDHTDPAKVAQALEILQTNKFITDREIQEGIFNRDYEDWQEEVTEEEKFRLTLPTEKAELDALSNKGAGLQGNNKNPQKRGSPSSNRKRSPSKRPRKS